ncbi:MAG: RNA methyltransferase, partial [Planctomycetota bacterium]
PVFEVADVAAGRAGAGRPGGPPAAAPTRGGAAGADDDFRARALVWVTGETGEAPPELAACEAVTIPMAGEVESLNVTVAGALLLFAAARSRRPERT